MEITQAFGIALRKARNEKGISQDHLSSLCGLDRTYIGLLERGQRCPSLKACLKISQALDIDTIDLLQSAFEIMKISEDK